MDHHPFKQGGGKGRQVEKRDRRPKKKKSPQKKKSFGGKLSVNAMAA